MVLEKKATDRQVRTHSQAIYRQVQQIYRPDQKQALALPYRHARQDFKQNTSKTAWKSTALMQHKPC